MAEGPAIEFVTTDETYLKDLVERSFLMMIEEKEEEKEKEKEKKKEKEKEELCKTPSTNPTTEQ